MRPAGWEKFYRVVERIPRGKVTTYGAVAQIAGTPRAARQVGYALAALRGRTSHGVPWHRVLGAGGRLTLAKLDPATAMTQRIRLEAEGVPFAAAGRVDLARCRWKVGAPIAPRARKTAARKSPAKRVR